MSQKCSENRSKYSISSSVNSLSVSRSVCDLPIARWVDELAEVKAGEREVHLSAASFGRGGTSCRLIESYWDRLLNRLHLFQTSGRVHWRSRAQRNERSKGGIERRCEILCVGTAKSFDWPLQSTSASPRTFSLEHLKSLYVNAGLPFAKTKGCRLVSDCFSILR